MKSKFNFTIFVLLLGCFLPSNSLAKYDASQLPIVVRNLPEWSNEYLTVINNWDGMVANSIEGQLPPLLSVVISINGKNTKGMDEETFNNLLMSQEQSIIEFLIKKDGSNERNHCTISYHQSIYWAEGFEMIFPKAFPENISMKNIKNASVFSFNTFAYRIGNMTEIDEASILEAAGKTLIKLGFRKISDISSADMVLELSKGRDEFNGYKITLNVLDGSKLRDGIERALWSLQVSDLSNNLKEQEGTLKTALNKHTNNFPFDMPTYSESINTIGIAFKSEQAVSTGKTLKILKGSDAYEKGLRSGDAIVGAYAGYSTSNFVYTKTRRYYFKPNKKDRQKNWGVDLFLILPIIPQFTFNNANHYLVDGAWRGGNDSRNHFKVKAGNGNTFVVKAPFTTKRFNLKYIR